MSIRGTLDQNGSHVTWSAVLLYVGLGRAGLALLAWYSDNILHSYLILLYCSCAVVWCEGNSSSVNELKRYDTKQGDNQLPNAENNIDTSSMHCTVLHCTLGRLNTRSAYWV